MLKPNSEIRELWAKAPFAVTFKVYIFNITNSEDVMRGGKVCLQFIYTEILSMKIRCLDEIFNTIKYQFISKKRDFNFIYKISPTTAAREPDRTVHIRVESKYFHR